MIGKVLCCINTEDTGKFQSKFNFLKTSLKLCNFTHKIQDTYCQNSFAAVGESSNFEFKIGFVSLAR